MTITAGALLGKASKILQDETNVRWPVTTEMIGWLDSAQRDVALIKPWLFTSTAARQLVAGTKQSLASGKLGLADIVRNMGTNGTTPGNSIQPKPREVMDILYPEWHTAPTSTVVKFFFHDPRNPKEYYVFPPQPASGMGYVEEVCFIAPTAIVDANSNIGLDDIYEGILINLVLARAFAKDAENPASAGRSQTYRAMAFESLGQRAAVEGAVQPTKEQG